MAVTSEERVLWGGHPCRRSILDLYVKGWFGTLLVAIVVAALTDVAAGHIELGWVVLVVAISLAGVFLAGLVKRKETLYTITSERLTIHTGLFARTLQETRLDRIQNVKSRQSVHERILGVGTIDFDTAAEAGYGFAFHGLARPHQVARTVDRALRDIPSPVGRVTRP